jgi:Glu-tRNA(Gln) amidotransferase subunit E-like FAD-binding protein
MAVKAGCDPRFTAVALMETLTSLKRKGVPIGALDKQGVLTLLEKVRDGSLPGELFAEAASLAAVEAIPPDEAAKRVCPAQMDGKELLSSVRKVVKAEPELAKRFKKGSVGPLMGRLRKEMGPRARGRDLYEVASNVLK